MSRADREARYAFSFHYGERFDAVHVDVTKDDGHVVVSVEDADGIHPRVMDLAEAKMFQTALAKAIERAEQVIS